jgi:NAD(P)-dependent dehydrogenase (short-subunit alcohol dehydrogenase family)
MFLYSFLNSVMMLEEKVCIVSGGGNGIGEATAKALAEYGATVVVNDLGTDVTGREEGSMEPAEKTAQCIRETGGEAMAHHGDVTSLEYTEKLVADTIAEYGSIHGAVNFAGVIDDGLSYKIDGDQWDRVINVHLRGHFSLYRALAVHWREQAREYDDRLPSQRSFLSVSSEAAMGDLGSINYTSAKAGILGLTQVAAREMYRYNVRANAMMPRAYTRMVENLPEATRPDEDMLPTPDSIAPLPVFLMSDNAEDITGCTLLMTGDEVALVSDPEIRRVGVKEEGWSADALASRFQESVAGNTDLKNVNEDWI